MKRIDWRRMGRRRAKKNRRRRGDRKRRRGSPIPLSLSPLPLEQARALLGSAALSNEKVNFVISPGHFPNYSLSNILLFQFWAATKIESAWGFLRIVWIIRRNWTVNIILQFMAHKVS